MSIEEEFEKLIPYMVEEFNEKNYTNKFHTLLHLEDLEVVSFVHFFFVFCCKYFKNKIISHVLIVYLECNRN